MQKIKPEQLNYCFVSVSSTTTAAVRSKKTQTKSRDVEIFTVKAFISQIK